VIGRGELEKKRNRDIYNNRSITATEKGRLFIITIDDFLLPYPVHADFLAMIDLLREAGYPAVLGVVTDTGFADPQTAALPKELSDSGWEIATHTNTHANLGEMENVRRATSSPRFPPAWIK
jgi:peptidoglycan/xylan/chitin deacetylase (PgdA/CDA1 family)